MDQNPRAEICLLRRRASIAYQREGLRADHSGCREVLANVMVFAALEITIGVHGLFRREGQGDRPAPGLHLRLKREGDRPAALSRSQRGRSGRDALADELRYMSAYK